MSLNALKEKQKLLKSAFNSRAGIATTSGLKGTAVTIQILSIAARAGLLATAAPLVAAATAGGGAIVAGAIVAADQFKKAAKKAGQEAIAEKGITLPEHEKKSVLLVSGGDGLYIDQAFAEAFYRTVQT